VAGCQLPFVGAASPQLFGWDNYQDLTEVRDLAKIFDRTEFAKWRSFRESEDSRYVGLTLPRTLARLPYGEETIPTETFHFRDKYDAAGYRKGQELLLLLNKTSEYGLTSPAGVEQGRFGISRDAKGNLTAVNGHGNVGLFANFAEQMKRPGLKLSPRASALVARHRQGPVPLPELEEIIKQFAGAR